MKGAATKWFEIVDHDTITTYAQFDVALRAAFLEVVNKVALEAELYGTMQKSGDKHGDFVKRKIELIKKLKLPFQNQQSWILV